MVSLVGQGYSNEDSDSEDTRTKRLSIQPSALSDDESDDENGPVSRPSRLNLDEYSSAELVARLKLKPPGSFNRELAAQKTFHNPHFLNTIIKKFKIEQYGTDYSKEVYCPKDCTTVDLCYTFLNEKVLEFERKRAAKEKEKKPEVTPEPTPAPPVDRRRASKWSEPVKTPSDAPMPLLPGLGLPLPAQASVPPSAPGQLPAAYGNPLQQAVAIAARLKTLAHTQHKPVSILPPVTVPTPAAVAVAVAAARERAAKALSATNSSSATTITTTATTTTISSVSISSTTITSTGPGATPPAAVSEEEITRKRQAALALLRESSEKKRKILSALSEKANSSSNLLAAQNNNTTSSSTSGSSSTSSTS